MYDGLLTEDTVIAAADGLSVADLDGEAVVLSPHNSTYFGLNAVGARAFALVRQPRPIREIVEAMLREYEASQDQLTGDLLRFFQEMKEARLIRVDA
jgi:hypothetical protein